MKILRDINSFHQALSKSVKSNLDTPFTMKENKSLTLSIGKLKAPSPNKFQAIFFQEYREIFSDDLFNFTLDFLNHSSNIQNIN